MTSNPAFELGPLDEDTNVSPCTNGDVTPENGDVAADVSVDVGDVAMTTSSTRQKHTSGPSVDLSPHTIETTPEKTVPSGVEEPETPDTPVTPGGGKPWFPDESLDEDDPDKSTNLGCKWIIVALVMVLVSFAGVAVLCWYGQTQGTPIEITTAAPAINGEVADH